MTARPRLRARRIAVRLPDGAFAPSPATALARARLALKTVEATHPRELRRRLLEVVAELVDADFVTFVRYDLDAGVLRYASINTTTAATERHLLDNLEGRPKLWDGNDHLRPDPAEVNRFVDDRVIQSLPLPPDNPLQRVAYAPFGVVDVQRALVFDGPRFIGHVSPNYLSKRVTHAGTDLLNRLMPEIQAHLVHADHLERGELLAPLHFVVRDTGHIDFATPAAEAWLSPLRRARIADIVRRADKSRLFDAVHNVEGARATLLRMHGDGVVYLLTLTSLQAPELAPDHALTPRQREVAEYAAAGATAREIGETLGLATETVRQHIKEIYRRLDIASRVELVAALALGRERSR